VINVLTAVTTAEGESTKPTQITERKPQTRRRPRSTSPRRRPGPHNGSRAARPRRGRLGTREGGRQSARGSKPLAAPEPLRLAGTPFEMDHRIIGTNSARFEAPEVTPGQRMTRVPPSHAWCAARCGHDQTNVTLRGLGRHQRTTRDTGSDRRQLPFQVLFPFNSRTDPSRWPAGESGYQWRFAKFNSCGSCYAVLLPVSAGA